MATSPTCLIVGRAPATLWGITGAERLRRGLARTPVTDVRHSESGSLEGIDLGPRVVVLRADHVFENVVLASLVETPDVALHVVGEEHPAAVHVSAERVESAVKAVLERSEQLELPRKTTEELCGAYNNKLRKREVPYLLHVTPQNKSAIEKRMFAGSYKGVTDIVTKYMFPWPSRIVTGWAANLHLKPNHITFVGLICVLASIWLWWIGEYAWGLLAAWTMCLLDTVDGKLARVTLTSSKFGDIFDHAIDLIHPPFWYWAWIVGLGSAFAELPYGDSILPVIVAGYIAQRLQEGYFIKMFGIEMHIWRRFDSMFRSVTARRDPNLLLLTIAWAVGEPGWGIFIIAVWVAICLGVHMIQIVQAHVFRGRGAPLGSWLAG